MAQLGIGVEFLHEFGKLEPSVRRRTVEAVEKFSAHTHAGLHLEKLTNPRDARVRTIRIDQFWRGVVLAPTGRPASCCCAYCRTTTQSTGPGRRTFSVNPVSGVLEVRDVVALEELTGPAAGADRSRPGCSRRWATRTCAGSASTTRCSRRAPDHRRGDAGRVHPPDAREPGRRPAGTGRRLRRRAGVGGRRRPAHPRRTVDTEDLAAAVDAHRAGSRWSTGPTSCSPCSPSRWPCGGSSCTRPRRRSPTAPRTGAVRRSPAARGPARQSSHCTASSTS